MWTWISCLKTNFILFINRSLSLSGIALHTCSPCSHLIIFQSFLNYNNLPHAHKHTLSLSQTHLLTLILALTLTAECLMTLRGGIGESSRYNMLDKFQAFSIPRACWKTICIFIHSGCVWSHKQKQKVIGHIEAHSATVCICVLGYCFTFLLMLCFYLFTQIYLCFCHCLWLSCLHVIVGAEYIYRLAVMSLIYSCRWPLSYWLRLLWPWQIHPEPGNKSNTYFMVIVGSWPVAPCTQRTWLGVVWLFAAYNGGSSATEPQQ